LSDEDQKLFLAAEGALYKGSSLRLKMPSHPLPHAPAARFVR